MPEVQADTFVATAPAKAYAAAKDLEGLAPYLKDVQSLKVLEAAPERSKSEFTAIAMGKKIHFIEVEEWNDAALKSHFYSPEGDFDLYEGDLWFTPEGEGTRIHIVVRYELNVPIFGGLLQKLILKLMKENAQGYIDGIKERCTA